MKKLLLTVLFTLSCINICNAESISGISPNMTTANIINEYGNMRNYPGIAWFHGDKIMIIELSKGTLDSSKLNINNNIQDYINFYGPKYNRVSTKNETLYQWSLNNNTEILNVYMIHNDITSVVLEAVHK